MKILENYSLKEHNTWRVGGKADHAVFPSSMEEVQEACAWAVKHKKPIRVLGGGSNVLVSDLGVEGLTVILSELSGVSSCSYEDGTFQLEALSGTMKSEVLRFFVKHRLSPALFFAGLPGDMGGGVVMNAGVGHDVAPREFQELVDWIEVVDLSGDHSLRRVSGKDIQWQYRHSEGWQPGIIVRVALRWQEEPREDLLNALKQSNQRRMSTQPLHYPSCGSVFRNPLGDKSGRLIESCGLKGYQVGGAKVSEKHANFIINVGGATQKDITDVMDHVRLQVFEATGKKLTPECAFLGRENS